MSETDEPIEAQLRLGWDPDAPMPPPLYSNYAGASFTPEDFSLAFGWYALPLTPRPLTNGDIDVPVQPVARVVLPLNLVRNVIALLQRQLEAYEESFGKVPAHPNPPAWLQEAEVHE